MTQAERKRSNRQPSKDVTIVYCRPDIGPYQFMDCLADLLMWDADHDRRVAHRVSFITGPRIASARNRLVAAALSVTTPWVLFLDADMTFGPGTLDRMLYVVEKMDIKFLSGLYFQGGRGYNIEPEIFCEVDGIPHKVVDYTDNMPVPIWACGAGCMLVHRNVLLDIEAKYGDTQYPWFEETVVDGEQWGEDVTFCRRVAEVGYEMLAHTGIEFGHMHLGAPLNSTEFRRRQKLTDEERDIESKAWFRMMGMA